jgi:hypothetical protein
MKFIIVNDMAYNVETLIRIRVNSGHCLDSIRDHTIIFEFSDGIKLSAPLFSIEDHIHFESDLFELKVDERYLNHQYLLDIISDGLFPRLLELLQTCKPDEFYKDLVKLISDLLKENKTLSEHFEMMEYPDIPFREVQ